MIFPIAASRMRWDLRDALRLLSLYLSGYSVSVFPAIKPKLTRLKSLTLYSFLYSNEHAQQLLHLAALKTLQV